MLRVFLPFIPDIKFVGRTSRGHTGGRSYSSGFVFIVYVLVYYYYHLWWCTKLSLFCFYCFFWCPCMAINVSVQYNGGLLPDIILLTRCYFHRGTRLYAMKRFCICSLWSHLNALTFPPPDWGMLRRSRRVLIFLSTLQTNTWDILWLSHDRYYCRTVLYSVHS